MAKITRCLNEWNAIIEALGQGKQTILIRNNPTAIKEFLLYPTISYAKNENVLNNFKEDYHYFVEENLLPNAKGKEYEIKYYAKVEKIINKSPRKVSALVGFHIWNKNHVNKFIRGKTPYVWVLRVYKLENPQFLSRTRGQRFANVGKEVDISDLTPVLSDEEFNKIKKVIDP
ncbi:DUF1802 family protein [uncultured Methanobrevibacter sp.]|uniref:DUF1802 family protein n=1 Tax=uncultured Methanobrevibacter sp. TaxID=253161 RepID=UPI0025E36ABE|nr:DUF1802 family protein [uncultured Methanobrevibacter sp.]